MTVRDVRVVYTKYDGSLHWHQTMQRLGEDEHGVWLGAGPGSQIRRGEEPPVVIRQPYVGLMPNGDQWWTAVFNGEPAGTEIYCDISTPPQWDDDLVTMVDLDLDVVRMRADQQVLLLDEDEFAEHQVRYGYPAEVVSQALQAAAWLQQAIKGGDEPFSRAFRPWLSQVS